MTRRLRRPVAVALVVGVSVAAALIVPGQARASWYGTSWQYRKQITIQASQVPSTVSNFPVLINLSSDGNLASHAQSSGNDILFTASDGTTKLNHEIETYSSSTGALVAWVQVPSVSGFSNTTIYMYYGNPSASNQQSVSATWDSNYSAVWHLPNGSSLSLSDSTSNARNGTNHSATATTGKIDGAANFSGSSQYVSVPSGALPSANNFTVSLWFKTSSSGALFSEQSASIGSTPGSWDPMLYVDSNGHLEGGVYTGSTPGITSSGTVNNGAWHYAVLTVNTTSATQTLYLDGSSVGSWSGTPEGPFTTVAVGAGYTANWPNPPSSGTSYFSGQIDDVRVSGSATARSANWISTEYNNQSSPSSFYTVGSEQVLDNTPPNAFSISSPSGGATISNGQTISSSPTDNVAIASVSYRYCSGSSCTYSAGTDIGSTSSGPPYTVTWSSEPSNGTYTLIARATDTSGNTTDSSTTTVTVYNATTAAWSLQTSGTSSTLYSVSCPSSSTCFAVGASGIVRATTNGGSSWSSQTSQLSGTNLYGLACPDTSHCLAVAQGGGAASTSSGGSTWTNISNNINTNYDLWSVDCISTSTCYMVGNFGTILVTTNFGSSTTLMTSGTSNNLWGVDCTNSSHCWAVGDSGTIRFYNGSSWSGQTSGTTSTLRAVSCVDSTHCWAVGASGTILFYNGSSWSSQTSGTSSTLYGVSCPASNTCWAVGASGTVVATSDGSTWSSQASGTSSQLDDVSFPDSADGWAVGANGVIDNYSGNALCSGGSLGLTAPSSVSFPATTLSGSNQTTSAGLTLTPDDETGNAAGWNITGTSTTLTNGASKTLATSSTTVTAGSASVANGNCTLPTNSISYPVTLPAGSSPPTAVKLYNAAANTGAGPSTINLTVQVSVPANAYQGTYTSTWTLAIVSGP